MRLLSDTLQGVPRFRAIGDNLADVQRWIKDTPPVWTSRSSTRSGEPYEWDFGVGYDGAMRLAEHGWSEGAKDLSDRLATRMPERDHIDSWRYDVAGELPDIGRFLAGDPAHMKRHGHPKGHQPIISMLVRICVSGGVHATTLSNYGAALCTVIDQLENMGRRVELNVADISMIGGLRCTLGWTVKQAEDPVDLAAVAFSLAHPAAPRRIGFAMCERTPRQDPTYGRPVDPVEEDWIDPLPGMYCLPGVGRLYGRVGLEEAVTHAVAQVNKAAGEPLVTVEG